MLSGKNKKFAVIGVPSGHVLVGLAQRLRGDTNSGDGKNLKIAGDAGVIQGRHLGNMVD
jgi:hypothetical protein